VHPADWFYLPVQWMYCNGVVSGYPDNTFRPNLPTTRGQIIRFNSRSQLTDLRWQ